MAAVTKRQDRRGTGTLVDNFHCIADEVDVKNVDSQPPLKRIAGNYWVSNQQVNVTLMSHATAELSLCLSFCDRDVSKRLIDLFRSI